VDNLVPLLQPGKKMDETGNQFSLTGVASITGGAAKKQFLDGPNETSKDRVIVNLLNP
jgi:hypothetical protein